MAKDVRDLELELAINENDLAALSFEVEDYVDRISNLFEQYDLKINKISSNYRSDAARRLVDQYNELKKSFSVVKKNIKTYSMDYRELIKILKATDRKFAGIVDSMAVEKATMAKNIYTEDRKDTLV